jgi:hypothetical protein
MCDRINLIKRRDLHMARSEALASFGSSDHPEVLMYRASPTRAERGSTGRTHAYELEVVGDELSQRLEAILPLLGQLLQEKAEATRARKLTDLVEFMTAQMVVPSVVDTRMAQRLAERHARVLNEFGHFSAEQLADLHHSRASSRTALADNWKRRRLVLALRHRDAAGVEREVFPVFQFGEDHKPLPVMQPILAAFGPNKSPWKLALWFTSANGWLPGSARPVDLLHTAPDSVVEAARRDAQGPAA